MVPSVVVNIHTSKATNHRRYVYIGRPSLYGNHFTHLRFLKDLIIVKTPQHAVDAYRAWLYGQKYLELEQTRRLKIVQTMSGLDGKILGCYCVPDPCHGNVLIEMLEGGFDITIKGVRYVRKSSYKENSKRG